MSIRRFLRSTYQAQYTINEISDLDRITKPYEDIVSQLKDSYPGSHDKTHMNWLQEVRNASSTVGSIYPVKYNPDHLETWQIVYTKLVEMHRLYTCEPHLKNLTDLQAHGIYSKEKIPDFNQINKFLRQRSGFQLVNIGGMVNSRIYLNALAFGVFYASQYIRHRVSPFYSVEPDIVHELMGHVPMFADENFAAFSREIGKLSLKATDDELMDIAKVYIFTIEYGVMQNKILGAGLLSSPSEIEHLITHKEKIRPWKLSDVLKYDACLTTYQHQYCDIQSLNYLKDILEELKIHLGIKY